MTGSPAASFGPLLVAPPGCGALIAIGRRAETPHEARYSDRHDGKPPSISAAFRTFASLRSFLVLPAPARDGEGSSSRCRRSRGRVRGENRAAGGVATVPLRPRASQPVGDPRYCRHARPLSALLRSGKTLALPLVWNRSRRMSGGMRELRDRSPSMAGGDRGAVTGRREVIGSLVPFLRLTRRDCREVSPYLVAASAAFWGRSYV